MCTYLHCACPFVAGQYGTFRVCFALWLFKNDSNSADVNWGALYDAKDTGYPYVANGEEIQVTVFYIDVLRKIKSSDHLLWSLTTIKSILFITGTTTSIWSTLCHGVVGHWQICVSILAGLDFPIYTNSGIFKKIFNIFLYAWPPYQLTS